MIRLIHSNKKIFLLVLLMVLLFCGQGWGATYSFYFADDGSDTNCYPTEVLDDACASGSPCLTTTCINTIISALSSSDSATFKFARDDQITISSSTPIGYGLSISSVSLTFDVWENGGSATPILTGASYQPVFEFSDEDVTDLTIKNINLIGNGTTSDPMVVKIYALGNVTIDNCTIDGNNGGTGNISESNQGCVVINHTTGNVTVTDNTIRNCWEDQTPELGAGLDFAGILIWMNMGSPPEKSTGTHTISGNTIYNVNSDGIHIAGVQNSTNRTQVFDNTIYNFGEQALDIKDSRYIDVYNNDFYRNDYTVAGSGGGYCNIVTTGPDAIWDAEPGGLRIYENYLHDNKYCAIRISGHVSNSEASALDSYIFQNYFYEVAAGILLWGGTGHEFQGEIFNNVMDISEDQLNTVGGFPEAGISIKDTDQLNVYNNSIWVHSPVGTTVGYPIQLITGSISNVVLKNNGLYTTQNSSSSYPLYCCASGCTPSTFDHNGYYNSNNSNTIHSNCGSSGGSDQTTDPNFSTFPKLNGNSPYISAGVDLGNATDSCTSTTDEYNCGFNWDNTTWTPVASMAYSYVDQDDDSPWDIGAAGVTTYYVNCDAGSSGDGSYGSPWNSLEDVESAGLNDGDDVYIYEGSTCTYNNPSGANFTMNWEGVDSNNHAIIGCYKDGPTMCSPGEFAIVDGSKTDWSTYGCPETTACDEEDEGTCVWYSLFRISGSYITISNLEIKNACGTLLVHTDNAAETDVHIEYNKLHDAGKNAILTYDSGSWFPCCSDGCGPSARTDFLIQYNEAYGTDKVHKYGPGGGFLSLWQQVFGLVVANSVIQYNYIHDAGGEGIMMRSKNTEPGNIVQYNHIRDVNPCAICIYRGQDHIIRYNLIVGDQSSVTYEGQGGGGRNWSEGILFLAHHTDTNGIQDIYVYGNIVMGCKMGVGFNLGGDHYTCGEPWARDEALTAYIYNNQFIDNYGNVYGFWNLGAGDDPSNTTIVYKNNISYHYGTGTEVLYWPASDKPTVTASNNLWESLPTGNASDFATNGYTGNPYIGVPSGDTDWQQIEATSDYTTEDTNIAANSNAIGKGTDLGGAGDCSSTISHNCGLSLTTDDVDFHDLPNTATFDLVDQGDNAVEIGPWVYTEDDQELPPNKGSFGLGARIQSN